MSTPSCSPRSYEVKSRVLAHLNGSGRPNFAHAGQCPVAGLEIRASRRAVTETLHRGLGTRLELDRWRAEFC